MATTMTIPWAEKAVLNSAGLRDEDITPSLIALASRGLKLCYYIDQAAGYVIMVLNAECQLDHDDERTSGWSIPDGPQSL